MNDLSLTIIIPILNEVDLIPLRLKILDESITGSKLERKQINIIICDGGSNDGSKELLQQLKLKYNFELVLKNLDRPSIGKTLNLARKSRLAKFCLCLPIDCHLSSDCLKALSSKLSQTEYVSGGFFKAYENKKFFYRFYSSVQNYIRSLLMRNLVWTNAIWMDSQLFQEGIIPQEGFLEDVILSDKLKKYPNLIIKEKIIVSSRKYHQKFLKRLWINLAIMVLFRFKLKSIEELKKIYQ